MADQLATPGDLSALLQRSDLDDYTSTMLIELATAQIQRICGGQRIIEVTDTAAIDVLEWSQWLDLPQRPIRTVGTVVIDGTTVTDFQLTYQRLWRRTGWRMSWLQPSQVLVTYTHGYQAGSQYLQLARQAALTLAAVGYGNPGQVTGESIDDYKVTYAEAAARMEVTPFMAEALRAAYGTTSYVTT